MTQVLKRRYGKALEEKKIPDVIFIDGGKGQLGMAIDVFKSLNVTGQEQAAADWHRQRRRSQGRVRNAVLRAGRRGISLPPDSPALHVIQHIRDDSHNHAITGHRQRRAKVRNTSALELIEGVGPKRRRVLLKYMGGLQPLLNASVEEIAKCWVFHKHWQKRSTMH